MSKATTFVSIYSLLLIALFATFSYLMSTVDPIKIKLGKYPKGESHDKDDSDDKGEDVDKAENGDKTEEGDKSKVESRAVERFAAFFDRRRRSKGKMLDDTFFSSSSMNNLSTEDTNSLNNEMLTNGTNQIINNLESTEDINKAMNFTHSAAFRRSVDVQKFDNKTDNIVLQIVDDDGYPVIEIKINNRINKSKKSKKRKSLNLKMAVLNDKNENEKVRSLLRNGLLKLLPDETIFIDQGNVLLLDATTKVSDNVFKDKVKDKINNNLIPMITTESNRVITTDIESRSEILTQVNTVATKKEQINITTDILANSENAVTDVNEIIDKIA